MKLQMTVTEVAALIEGHVEGSAERTLVALRSLEAAGPSELAVLFRGAAEGCRAGCLVVAEDSELVADEGRSLIRVSDPEDALDVLASRGLPAPPAAGRHPTAVVAEDAVVAADASLGPHCVVGAGARVGARSRLAPGVTLGAGVHVGADCELHAQVVVEHDCRLGDRVVIHAGTVIGADGFGYRQQGGRHVKSPQVGRVEIGDDVEIGAHTTIDRGRLEPTTVGAGTKIDDHVHIAHNCRIGEGCALAGTVALSGGVVLGRGVLMGGRSGASDGVTIGDGAVLGGCAVAKKDVPAGAFQLGDPATDHRSYKREVLSLRRLPDLIARLRSETRGA
jgi:UDP-3-O-[3-hydroxymyristoyl] glucosamine N-acyltransferase